ncbi:hypothetical protein D5086_023414 [Populus alba]|uniref:Uncharacterized protein n=1 Tax=Populus alba TaxID=43335 RepID=A0ACC4BBJ0_POPAL
MSWPSIPTKEHSNLRGLVSGPTRLLPQAKDRFSLPCAPHVPPPSSLTPWPLCSSLVANARQVDSVSNTLSLDSVPGRAQRTNNQVTKLKCTNQMIGYIHFDRSSRWKKQQQQQLITMAMALGNTP